MCLERKTNVKQLPWAVGYPVLAVRDSLYPWFDVVSMSYISGNDGSIYQ